MLKQLQGYVFQTDRLALCTIDRTSLDLCIQNGFDLQSWDEDGLGKANGFICKTDNDLIILVEELEHKVNFLGFKGVDIYVDAQEIVNRGFNALIQEILDAFNVLVSDLIWLQSEDIVDFAQKTVFNVNEYKKYRDKQ